MNFGAFRSEGAGRGIVAAESCVEVCDGREWRGGEEGAERGGGGEENSSVLLRRRLRLRSRVFGVNIAPVFAVGEGKGGAERKRGECTREEESAKKKMVDRGGGGYTSYMRRRRPGGRERGKRHWGDDWRDNTGDTHGIHTPKHSPFSREKVGGGPPPPDDDDMM